MSILPEQLNTPALDEFSDWYGWFGVSNFYKNGHEYIEYQNFEDKTKAGMVRCTIDGVEETEFTRVSQCHDAPTYAEVTGTETKVEHIKCSVCQQDCLTYLTNA